MDSKDEQTAALMTKLKHHYRSRDFRPPPEAANRLAIGVFWGMTLGLMYSSLWVIIPSLTRGYEDLYWRMAIPVWVIFAETVLNWFLCARRYLTVVKRDPGKPLPPYWTHCVLCQMDAPPRSHHCSLCKFCVLKHDHHCFFVGTCIGFYNQRYFVVLLLYMMVGGAYGLTLLFTYLHDPLPFWSNFWTYLPPGALYQWLFGGLSGGLFLCLLQIYLTTACSLAALFFFVIQGAVIYWGQTQHEVEKLVTRYRVDPAHHMRSVFGPYWLLNLVVPMPFGQASDGVNWNMEKSLLKDR